MAAITPAKLAPVALSPVVVPPSLIDFLNNVPPSLTHSLVTLAPYIAVARRVADIVNWKSSYSNSWLLIAAWWAFCLLSSPVIRYALPLAIVLTLVNHPRSRRTQGAPATEQSIQSTVVDLTVIEASLPSNVDLPAIPLNALVRACAILYVPYLVATYYVRLKVLIAISGTVLLMWRAPWAQATRRILWRSAWLRWCAARAWGYLSGLPPPMFALAASLPPSPPLVTTALRFLFTIHENQRWWVGLDWTAALLPGERPSWCAAAQQAVAPPSAFALPSPKSVVLADGHGGAVKRTARWHWEEGEWRVVVKRADAGLRRLERQVPVGREELPPSASRIDKTMQKMKELGARRGSTGEAGREAQSLGADDVDEGVMDLEPEQSLTDADGWVYGDNQWKSPTGSGGMGKYTRYRRWTRIAVLSETIEPASANDLQLQEERIKEASIPLPSSPASTDFKKDNVGTIPTSHSDASTDHGDGIPGSPSRLRSRLKAAVYAASL